MFTDVPVDVRSVWIIDVWVFTCVLDPSMIS
jgi:hypothetical protein